MSLVGGGAYGKVWVGATGDTVIKVVDLENDNVMREVHIMRRIKHPNVLRLLHHWVRGGMLNMMSRRYQMDLHVFIREGVYNTLAAQREIVRQMLMGVRAIHRARIVHADLKPRNIFLNVNPIRLVVGDLGAAMRAAPGRKVAYYTTEEYRAPEIAVQPLMYDTPEILQYIQFKADAYSVAMIIYELVYGVKHHDTPGLETSRDGLLARPFAVQQWKHLMHSNPRARCSVHLALKRGYFRD